MSSNFLYSRELPKIKYKSKQKIGVHGVVHGRAARAGLWTGGQCFKLFPICYAIPIPLPCQIKFNLLYVDKNKRMYLVWHSSGTMYKMCLHYICFGKPEHDIKTWV